MCKSKEEFPPFGKVCDVHNNGNKATIEMCSQITGVASEKVSAVFNDLRKEGKGLPEPSQEEVKEYASSQVFIAKYDPKIQDKSRNRIVNWWRKARDTQPSGGLMHAWKNTLPQTLARYRRTTLASVAMFSIALTSACGSTPPQNNNENTSSPIATTAPATPSEEATVKPTETAKPSPTQEVKTKEIQALEKNGISLGKIKNVSDGSYPSYKVSKESALSKYDPSKQIGGMPDGWSNSDMKEAHLYASNFLMNSVLNNEGRTNFDKNKGELIKSISKEVSPEFKKPMLDILKSNDTTLLPKDIFSTPEYKGYTLVNDGKTPRIKNVDIKINSSQSWNGDNYIEYSGTYTLSAVNSKTGVHRDIDAKMKYGLTIKKSGESKYKISGINSIEGLYEDIQ